MKTRISALLLVAVMLLGAFSINVSAASMPELKSYITNVTASNPTGKVVIALPGDTAVTTATTIPANITVYVGTGVKLYVSAALTVYGELRAAIPSDIVVGSGGSVTNSSVQYPGTNYWTGYNPAYPWTINPPQGPYCATCTTNTKIWCHTCSAYHCKQCTPCYSQPIAGYCHIHQTNRYYCTRCEGYYCQSCDNGIHAYDNVQKKCITVPFTHSTSCPTHAVSRLYCNTCRIYYCPACIGGVHMIVNGKCTVYSGVTQSFCYTHNASKLYCNNCNKYYCPACDHGYHTPSALDPTKCTVKSTGTGSIYYCPTHNTARSYCSKCNEYYCPSCLGGYHYYYDINSPCYIYSGGTSPIGDPYYYHNYVYIPGYGWITTNVTCSTPVASIADGATVDKGTKVTLTTTTPGAVIYYTTNGSAPNASSIKYTEPIVINGNVTIHAVAVHTQIYSSPVAKFIYKIKASPAGSSFKDLSGYPGLSASLDKLIAKKVITASASFNPKGKISWNDVSSWYEALGVDVSKSGIKAADFADSGSLTYEEMVLACYKIMRAEKIIAAPRAQGSVNIQKLTHNKDITDKAIYKAAYASLIENKVLYGLSFRPQDPANRAYLATAVAWASSKVK